MKKGSQPQHTQGEWRMVTGLKKAGDLCIHVRGKQICDFPDYNSTLEDNAEQRKKIQEAEANAQRIVKAVNMHDELVEGIRRLINELIYSTSNQCKVLAMTDEQIIDTVNKNSLIIKYRQLLKQAAEK